MLDQSRWLRSRRSSWHAASQPWQPRSSGAGGASARPRTVLRTISGVMVPTAMVTISFAPLLAGRLDSTIGSSEARAILFSSVTFGSASLIAGIWFGRRVGSLVGVAGYLGGLVAQMLQLPLPAPYEGSDDSLLMPGISCTLLALGVVCMAATLGRASGGAASP